MKNKNLVHVTFLSNESNEMSSVSHVTCVDLIAQVFLTPRSIFLFLDVPTRNFRIIIIILPTDRPDIILQTARTTNN